MAVQTIAVAVNARIGQHWLLPLAAALSKTWQYVVLAAAAVALLALRRSVVVTLAAGMVGAIAELLDASFHARACPRNARAAHSVRLSLDAYRFWRHSGHFYDGDVRA
jgi:hypothetical protein